jgi:hypothetical protein
MLLDPIAPAAEIEELAADRETAAALTAPWHERDSRRLVEQLGVPVYTPMPDTAEYLMQTYGITAAQAGDGSPDSRLAPQGRRREINERWLQLQGAAREQAVAGLRLLLDLPVEHVLATHGGPHERPALERALCLP